MATITEDYVSLETAKLLKKKGFPQDPYICNTAYTANGKLSNNAKSFMHPSYLLRRCCTIAPTLQMACKWLREKHNIYISIQPDFPSELNYKMCWYWSVSILQENAISLKRYQTYIETYEQATEAAIMYCLEYLI